MLRCRPPGHCTASSVPSVEREPQHSALQRSQCNLPFLCWSGAHDCAVVALQDKPLRLPALTGMRLRPLTRIKRACCPCLVQLLRQIQLLLSDILGLLNLHAIYLSLPSYSLRANTYTSIHMQTCVQQFKEACYLLLFRRHWRTSFSSALEATGHTLQSGVAADRLVIDGLVHCPQEQTCVCKRLVSLASCGQANTNTACDVTGRLSGRASSRCWCHRRGGTVECMGVKCRCMWR